MYIINKIREYVSVFEGHLGNFIKNKQFVIIILKSKQYYCEIVLQFKKELFSVLFL